MRPIFALAALTLSVGLAAHLSTGYAQDVEQAPLATDVTDVTDGPRDIEPFPRTRKVEGGTFVMHEPQLKAFDRLDEITAVYALEYYEDGSEDPMIGVGEMTASVQYDFDESLVTVYDRKITKIAFPKTKEKTEDRLEQQLRTLAQTQAQEIPLDVVLEYLADQEFKGASANVSMDPPKIFYRDIEAILVIFDGEPIFVTTGVDGLEFAINTNWDILRDTATNTFYLLNGDTWLKTKDINAPWEATAALPLSVSQLPETDNWVRVREALPAKPVGEAVAVIVTLKPAELISTTGAPELETIADTSLAFVDNTSADLFFMAATNTYYYLVSGRWFKSESLEGPWKAALPLPSAFSDIPEDHPVGDVRSSIPGTREAQIAVIQAQLPKTLAVKRNEVKVQVYYAGSPKFEQIEGTSLARAVNTSFDVIQAGDHFYLCYHAVWFVSTQANGPWDLADMIPAEIYDIPANSPAHHVTYVQVYDSTADVVYVRSTPGYHHSYISFGVVVYGSGYYWPPYYYNSYYGYPYYYAYPYSYGAAAYYNPTTGRYGRAGWAYGPYGGYGRSATYNPRTGAYSHGVAAWDSNDGYFAKHAYNPRTGVETNIQRRYDGKDNQMWGSGTIRKGDQWVQSSVHANEDYVRRDTQTSGGGESTRIRGEDHSVTAVRTGEGDLFVGVDGNVYRQSPDGGWEGHENGQWKDSGLRDQANREGAGRDQSRSGDGRSQYSDRTAGGAANLGNSQANQAFQNKISAGNRDYSSADRLSGLDRDARARSQGNQRYQSAKSSRGSGGSYRQSGSNRSSYSRSGGYSGYGGGARGGGSRGGGGRGR